MSIAKQFDGNQTAENEIRASIQRWASALESRDLDSMFQEYAEDAMLYDVMPPYKTVGIVNIRKIWENCLPYFPAKFKSEHRDIVVHADENIAVMHCVHHFSTEDVNHPCSQSWFRATVSYRRMNGQWKIFHEHVSLPFNPMNNQVWFIRNPDQLDLPDYSSNTPSNNS